MKKLVEGVVDFHVNVLPGLSETFAQLAEGQKPDTLLVTCSDSRVAVNLFASTNPGEMFVVRNAGNIVPTQQKNSIAYSESIAIDLAVSVLKVKDIIVCGHSNCAAMKALLHYEDASKAMKSWIDYGQLAKDRLNRGDVLDPTLPLADQLSQLSVLVQLHNLRSYPTVVNAMERGALNVHGW